MKNNKKKYLYSIINKMFNYILLLLPLLSKISAKTIPVKIIRPIIALILFTPNQDFVFVSKYIDWFFIGLALHRSSNLLHYILDCFRKWGVIFFLTFSNK